jgi:hypothetical protein
VFIFVLGAYDPTISSSRFWLAQNGSTLSSIQTTQLHPLTWAAKIELFSLLLSCSCTTTKTRIFHSFDQGSRHFFKRMSLHLKLLIFNLQYDRKSFCNYNFHRIIIQLPGRTKRTNERDFDAALITIESLKS